MKIFFFIFLCGTGTAFAQILNFGSYDSCVLNGLKNANTDAAIRLLHLTCNKKFINRNSQSYPDVAALVCELNKPGPSTFFVSYNLKLKILLLNDFKWEISHKTKDKIFAYRESDKFSINFTDLSAVLSGGNGGVVPMSCGYSIN